MICAAALAMIAFPVCRLSGKGDLAGDGAFHQLRSHLSTRPMHHIGRARRQARVADGPHKLGRRQWRLAGRLGHEGAAGGKSGGDLPGQEVHGIVPGGDEGTDPYGLAEHDAAAVRSCDPFAEVSLALFGVVVEHISRGEKLHLCVLEGLSLLLRQKPGDLLRPLPNQPGRLVQHLRPLCAGRARPDGKSLPGRLQGQAGVLARAHGHLGHRLLVSRIVDRIYPARDEGDDSALDEHMRLMHATIKPF